MAYGPSRQPGNSPHGASQISPNANDYRAIASRNIRRRERCKYAAVRKIRLSRYEIADPQSRMCRAWQQKTMQMTGGIANHRTVAAIVLLVARGI